jgi:hypothetical protein
LGLFGPKAAEIRTYRTTSVYHKPFKKDSSTGSRAINEVVLDGSSATIKQGVVRTRTRLLSEARGMPYSEVGRVRMLRW